jgi:hypothetical protein
MHNAPIVGCTSLAKQVLLSPTYAET